jgi:hypothetical protein
MTGRLFLSVILFIVLPPGLLIEAANVSIYGTNKDYAGKELEFFIYKERIFDSYESLAKVKVNTNGEFSLSFSINETQCVYCRTPLYTAFIFTEPGKSYQVKLPPTQSMGDENRISPFFIPPLWHMLPLSDSKSDTMDLNEAVYKFDEQFDPFLDKQIVRYYDPQLSREKLDSFCIANKDIPVMDDKGYFESYRQYKIASLGFMVNQFSHADLLEKYIEDKPVRSDIPSWWEFFNLYFDGYFSSLSVNKEFSELYSFIGNGDYYSLNQLLKKDPALKNDQIREWVILKEIHNAYYGNNLPLSTLLTLCDSISGNSTDKVSISMSNHLKKEAPSLLPGNSPPSEILVNLDGDSVDISTSTGKYNYIGFCSLINLESLQEFEYLKYFYSKYGEYLDFRIILPESEKDNISSFTNENSIPWKFWYYREVSKILNDYKVRAFPVFYLLDREGKLLMSPATLPSAGFEKQLFSILKGRGEI